MAKYSPKYWRNCATCEFWLGVRSLNAAMAAAEVDEHAQGTCRTIHKNPKRYATSSCPGWKPWATLPTEDTLHA